MNLSFHSDPLVEKRRIVLQAMPLKEAVIASRELVRASHAARDNHAVPASEHRAMARDHCGATGSDHSVTKDHRETKEHHGAAAAESNAPNRPLAKKEPQELRSKELRIPESRRQIHFQWNRVLLKAATKKGATRIAPPTTRHPNDVPTADHHDEVEQKAS
jgi:hypothetical protein